MPCKRKATACDAPAAKRPAASILNDVAVQRALVQCGTKKGLVDCISALSQRGWLTDTTVHEHSKTLHKKLALAEGDHASARTPYGPVVQQMQLPLESLPQWDYCHPMALVYYLCSISQAFAGIMMSCSVPTVAMRIIIYIDEICPGNPLRPEKSRTLQSIYWAFVDWPAWLLQRTAAWPVFGTIRSKLVEKLPGGVNGLMRRIVNVFSPPVGALVCSRYHYRAQWYASDTHRLAGRIPRR